MVDVVRVAATAGRFAASYGRIERRSSIAFRLALRNLARDRVRMAITVVGVAFSVVLMALQLALLIGFALTSSSMIDRAPADFWIMPRGTQNVDQTGTMAGDVRYQTLALPGVASATKMLVRFIPWKRPDGGIEAIILVGVDVDQLSGLPWSMESGSPASLKFPDAVIIDRLYAKKLGIANPNETVEINGHRARVVGFTAGIRAFTQAPYVFASYKTAETIGTVPQDRTSYVLVTAREGADRAQLGKELAARFPEYDVLSASRFAWQTRIYWLLTTGAGAALLIAAFLGLVVGIVIVTQTLYAATVERLKEYATLRAMGAGNVYLRGVVLRQALLSAAIGYGLGMAVAEATIILGRNGAAAFVLPWPVWLCLAVLTFVMCGSGAYVSLRKVFVVDPATVFKS
jgi:putative ABC transport system permease protein